MVEPKKIKEFPCDKCDKTFRNPNYLELHKVSMHQEGTTSDTRGVTYLCHSCNKTFDTIKPYATHKCDRSLNDESLVYIPSSDNSDAHVTNPTSDVQEADPLQCDTSDAICKDSVEQIFIKCEPKIIDAFSVE